MKKENVVIGGLYIVKDTPSLFEIKTEMDNYYQVEGLLYIGNEKPERTIMKISELTPITITEEILHLLSFTEIDGNLEGLPNEHYFELKTQDEPIRMKTENGRFCYVQKRLMQYSVVNLRKCLISTNYKSFLPHSIQLIFK